MLEQKMSYTLTLVNYEAIISLAKFPFSWWNNNNEMAKKRKLILKY